jgi:hypothetical protein
MLPKSRKNGTKTQVIIRQAFREETMSRTWKPKLTETIKKRYRRSKVKSMFMFFDVKVIVQKEFVLAGQTVNSVY